MTIMTAGSRIAVTIVTVAWIILIMSSNMVSARKDDSGDVIVISGDMGGGC